MGVKCLSNDAAMQNVQYTHGTGDQQSFEDQLDS